MEVVVVNKSSHVYFDFPEQRHGYWEVMFCLFGTGTVDIDGANYPFVPGTVFCIPPDTIHSKKASDGFIDGILMLKDFIPPDSRPIPVFADSGGAMRKLFELALQAKNNNQPNSDAVVNSLVEAIYQMMINKGMLLKRNTTIEAFQNLLWNNISNFAFSIEDEIQKIGYSKSYFRALFRQCTGYSVKNYFIRLRLEHSKNLLVKYHDVMSIRDIALESGYDDPYYFSRLFKKYTGCSPRAYLKRLGNFDYNSLVANEDPESRFFSQIYNQMPREDKRT